MAARQEMLPLEMKYTLILKFISIYTIFRLRGDYYTMFCLYEFGVKMFIVQ